METQLGGMNVSLRLRGCREFGKSKLWEGQEAKNLVPAQ